MSKDKRVSEPVNTIEAVLGDREKTHGSFKTHALYTQQLKRVAHGSHKWEALSDEQKESIDMILHKIGRIINGNPNVKDHWTDISGYSTLVEKELK